MELPARGTPPIEEGRIPVDGLAGSVEGLSDGMRTTLGRISTIGLVDTGLQPPLGKPCDPEGIPYSYLLLHNTFNR